MPERIISLTDEITELVSNRVRAIQRVTMTTQLLALNAAVEESPPLPRHRAQLQLATA